MSSRLLLDSINYKLHFLQIFLKSDQKFDFTFLAKQVPAEAAVELLCVLSVIVPVFSQSVLLSLMCDVSCYVK